MPYRFDYDAAFARNIGWVTDAEQRTLKGKRIAIAGMGGVGGGHLLTLARLGVGAFKISDFDTFDIANFNRQAGATISSLDRPKVDVLAEMVCEINPECDLQLFPTGVSEANLDDFLEGVDLYVDALDFFAFDARSATFAACRSRGIPAVTAAPLGGSAAVLVFTPGGMSFEDYFRLDGCSDAEKSIRFLLGLAPAMLHFGYLADPTRVDLEAHRGPSLVIACQLCVGMAAAEALKILLARGKVTVAPRGYQFDAYLQRFVRTWRPGGNNNPLQRVALAIARKRLQRMKRQRSERV